MNQVLEICKPTHYLSYKPDIFFLKFILAKTGTLMCDMYKMIGVTGFVSQCQTTKIGKCHETHFHFYRFTLAKLSFDDEVHTSMNDTCLLDIMCKQHNGKMKPT